MASKSKSAPKSTKKSATKKTSSAKKNTGNEDSSLLDSLLEGNFGSLLGGVKNIPGQAMKIATEMTWDQAAKLMKHSPEQMERMGKAGTSLKDLREVTGLTIAELSEAIDLKNPDLLKAVEEGKTALPFEIILRLASFYARNDPIPFILRYANTYNPRIANLLKKLGLHRLTMQAEREVLFLNIYRSQDASRKLSDEGFERVRAFTQQAFEMSLHFVAEQEHIVTSNGSTEKNKSGNSTDGGTAKKPG
ncbi:MAG: helix-turn-helix transcriptional regulator [Porticoccaceae bacterium]|nr:helix-turn-helix transcriptional regulator [Pseudomonadales bacterium]MCP5172719.1 helix-turn-helix transcriptional regulator [Pseudomonadales bacterium]MCP5302193.1 helix-turn-helix transcriptional regulator [Pseudomonadales bacterium]